MDALSSFFNAVNLPATMLLILVLFYWSLVIFGMLDLGVFDFDWNFEPTAPTDGVPDISSATVGVGGAFKALLGFFYLGRVPTMFLVSVFALIFWTATVSTNLYLNPNAEMSRGLWLWAPIMAGSLILSKVFFWPFLAFFDEMTKNHGELENTLVGKMATVSTSEVTETFGQITIEQQGPPIVLNARAAAMDRFAKGEVVQILSHDSQSNTYLIAAVGGKK
jgi:hypothetical protein